MCYAKPGPRCSAHAKAALQQAAEAFAKAVRNNEATYDTYVEVEKARHDYELTPAGQKELREQIAVETDDVKKAELARRLKESVKERKAAIAAFKATEKKPVVKKAGNKANKNPTNGKVPTSPFPASDLHYDDRHSVWGNSFEYEYDQSFCTCDDWPCRCKSIGPVEITRLPTAEGWVEEVYNVPTGQEVPAELIEKFKDYDFADQLEPNITSGFYGEELSGFAMSEDLYRKTREAFYSQPNAGDPQESLEYARQEGVNTTGLTPVEAVKATVLKKLPKTAAERVASATTTKNRNIPFSQISTVGTGLSQAEAYDFSKQQYQDYKMVAGVLVEIRPGHYQLVGGVERYKAAVNTGKKSWQFQILSKGTGY